MKMTWISDLMTSYYMNSSNDMIDLCSVNVSFFALRFA